MCWTNSNSILYEIYHEFYFVNLLWQRYKMATLGKDLGPSTAADRPKGGGGGCPLGLAVWLLDHFWPLDFCHFSCFWFGWHFAVTRFFTVKPVFTASLAVLRYDYRYRFRDRSMDHYRNHKTVKAKPKITRLTSFTNVLFRSN